MKSPFPGMDPYLEQHWRDVHSTLVVLGRGMIQRQLGGGLRARIEERLVVESVDDEPRGIHPDVRVVEHEHGGVATRIASSGVALAEPLKVDRIEAAPQRFIEIIEPGGGKLVTVIEFVSPSNKNPGDAHDQYVQKRKEVLDANVNFVEIDLVRNGRREATYPVLRHPQGYLQWPYAAVVYRGTGRRRFEFYPLPLRQRLPGISIPLRATDADIALDLQALVDQAYQEGAFDDIDYTKPARPPLDGDDAEWADAVLKEAGKRSTTKS